MNDPVSVQLSESLSDLYVDHQISLTFLPDEVVSTATPRTVCTEMDPNPLYTFHPQTTRRDGDLIQVQGETLLSRLNRIYPGIRPTDNDGAGWTPREALLEIISQWQAAGYDWIELQAGVPEFQFRTLRTDTYPTGLFTPRLAMIALDPDEEESLSAYEILSRFFEPFAGYSFRVNSSNQIEVISPQWLEEYTPLVLTASQVAPVQAEDLDASQVFNKCTIESRGYVLEPDQPVMPQAYIVSDTHDIWELPDDTTDLNGGKLWIRDQEVLIGGGNIELSITLSVYHEWQGPFWSGSSTSTATQNVLLPMDGSTTILPWMWYSGVGSEAYGASMEITANLEDGELKSISVTVQSAPTDISTALERRWLAWKWILNATGLRFQQAGQATTGRYTETTIPGTAESREAYGIREKKLTTGVYSITDAGVLNDMAASFVADHLNPLRKITVQQVLPYPVRPEHVGKPVVLPDGRAGTVLDWSYQEAHTPSGSSSSSEFVLQVVESLTLENAGKAAYGEAQFGLAIYGGA